MPELKPIDSVPKLQETSNRPQSLRTRKSSGGSFSNVSRVFTTGHLDDNSTYHGDGHDAKPVNGVDEPDYSDEAREEEDEEAKAAGEDEVNIVQMGVRATRDLEAGSELKKQQTSGTKRSDRSARDPNLVSWDGLDDKGNPKNWDLRHKWAATVIVSAFTFISPVSSSMVAPALSTIATEFGITNQVESQLVLSIFVLAYAVGPLFLGPLSEIYGRVPVLQTSNLVYLAFNTGCGFCKNKNQMLAFRFLSGLGGSAPLAIGGGVLSDAWKIDERGRAIAIYSLAPLLGPAIGPIAGGFITQNTSWRWAFYATSIADAVIQGAGLFLLRETYPPKILHLKAGKLRKETGNMKLHTAFEHPERGLAKTMEKSLIRPFRLLGTQPIVQVLALWMAYLYGLMYLILSSLPETWVGKYHEAIGIGGLNYISLGVGFTLGTQICAPLNDRIFRWLRNRNEGKTRPEFRVPLMVPGSFLVPIGLFIYGWSVQEKTHWIVPNIGVAIFAAGVIVGFQCIQTYIIDAYVQYAASAIAAATVLRSLAGFGFPLFAPYMYNALGDGWGNSLLGFIAIGLGLPAPFLLWRFGEKLRNRSKFAAGGDE